MGNNLFLIRKVGEPYFINMGISSYDEIEEFFESEKMKEVKKYFGVPKFVRYKWEIFTNTPLEFFEGDDKILVKRGKNITEVSEKEKKEILEAIEFYGGLYESHWV